MVVVLTGEGQIMVQNAFKLHSTTCIPLIRYKSTFLQLINNLTTAIQQFLCSRENEDNLIIYSSTGQANKACSSRI